MSQDIKQLTELSDEELKNVMGGSEKAESSKMWMFK